VKLGSALFFAYFLIFALCLSYPIARIAGSLRVRYLESVEEPLVDEANLLATVIGHLMEAGHSGPDDLSRLFEGAHTRILSAQIYAMRKRHIDAQIYVTDAAGMVLFDSENPANVGADYAQLRDVALTLQGRYGARTTRRDPKDPASAVLYIAAPIRLNGEIVGSLTVAEPTTSVNAFLRSAKFKIFRTGALATLAAMCLSLLVSGWLSSQIRRLTFYANDVREGRRVELPRLAPTELRDMGHAFDKMRESLEGKKYVEQYVQTLTHEIKSPVSAIRGAAELLEEEMPLEKRNQFLSNIRNEAERIGDLVERMLSLSELETRKSLETVEIILLENMIRSVQESKAPILAKKDLQLRVEAAEGLAIEGDPFLLHQAIANLLQNAIDFSPSGRAIRLCGERAGPDVRLSVEDAGPGIPPYAKEKVFQKFFSLQRPDTGKKGTGLGLTIAQEIASLHGGEVRLENLSQGGFRASLLLPSRRGR
jgi:two-component system sensor histidine kinase CreC